VLNNLIPWDKSWLIRMGVLDLLWGRQEQTVEFLNNQEYLGDDLVALKSVCEAWELRSPMPVGESGTLYRFLRFACWKLNLKQEFILEGTLKTRPIAIDPRVILMSQIELLKLDHGTSQWASAAVLCGDQERLLDAPFKLRITYEAVEHWHKRRSIDRFWKPRKDSTIEHQADAFDRLMNGKSADFSAKQAEDFCFAYALCGLSAEEGEKRWPSLRGHESDRIVEMELAMAEARAGSVVESRDHRVVQAAAMWLVLNGRPALLRHPAAVNKSWPQFWEFLKQCV
jgi:hypothetical protein